MITSPHNPRIRRMRALLGRARDRRDARAFVAEGVRLVEEAHAAGWQPELVLFSEALGARGRALVEGLAAGGCEIEEVSEPLMRALSETETPQGILAVLPERELPIAGRLDFALVADALRDPGNAGTLLRSAAAAGVGAVFFAPGCADPFAPKVVRAAMGAHFRVPIRSASWEEIRAALKGDVALQVYLAEAGRGAPYWQPDLTRPLALVVGGEASGPGAAARALADGWLNVPMPGQSESLNAAVAASILLFEVVRQRSLAAPGA